MGFGDLVDGFLEDINPLHWINKLNEAIGHSTADILEFLGITDPAVDPDGIRAIAKTWKDLADTLGEANFAAGQAVLGLGLDGEVGTAFAERVAQLRNRRTTWLLLVRTTTLMSTPLAR